MDVVLASRNRGKLAELQALLKPLNWRLQPLSDFTEQEAEEVAPTFLENALLKARFAARVSGRAALADDSGLEVDALHGAPGVRSARYAGGGGDAANNRKLLESLAAVAEERRSARFVCVMAFLRHAEDPVPVIAQGLWPGRILRAPRGGGGFGYDPLFFVPGHGCAAAELPPEEKNHISHRAQAAQALLMQLRESGIGNQAS
jgi:XTP/dITP diphosphohydrolase